MFHLSSNRATVSIFRSDEPHGESRTRKSCLGDRLLPGLLLQDLVQPCHRQRGLPQVFPESGENGFLEMDFGTLTRLLVKFAISSALILVIISLFQVQRICSILSRFQAYCLQPMPSFEEFQSQSVSLLSLFALRFLLACSIESCKPAANHPSLHLLWTTQLP